MLARMKHNSDGGLLLMMLIILLKNRSIDEL